MIFSANAFSGMDSAITALMDEEKIQYLSTRGSEAEPTLLVSVKDDGASRDGYAEYLCLVLKEHDADNNVLIKIIDAQMFSEQQNERVIGSHICTH